MSIEIDPGGRRKRRQERESGGLAGHISRVSKQAPPAPKGRGIVLVLLGLAVIYALVDTFASGSSAGKVIERNHANDPGANPPVAKGAPIDGDERPVMVEDNTTTRPYNPDTAAGESDDLGGVFSGSVALPEGLAEDVERDLRVNLFVFEDLSDRPALAVHAALGALPPIVERVPPARQAELRTLLLEQFQRVAGSRRFRGRALAAAAWIAPDVKTMDPALFALLKLAMGEALRDDAAAPGAIAFLGSLPDSGGAGAVGALDDVILDPMRPLHVRTAAARIRPKGSRSQDMMDLQASPETHPALRRALGEELR